MRSRRISTVFAATLTLVMVGIFSAATPASATDPLCEATAESCMNGCPDPSDCNKPGPACTNMVRKCRLACAAQLKACVRKHPG